MTAIDFSAQFGGQDAADTVLPHFRALKKSAEGVEFDAFPFPKLAYILRVSGSITSFGPSGAENLDIDRRKRYLSVDIVLAECDRASPQVAILVAMDQSVDLIRSALLLRRMQWDEQALRNAITQMTPKYLELTSARSYT